MHFLNNFFLWGNFIFLTEQTPIHFEVSFFFFIPSQLEHLLFKFLFLIIKTAKKSLENQLATSELKELKLKEFNYYLFSFLNYICISSEKIQKFLFENSFFL